MASVRAPRVMSLAKRNSRACTLDHLISATLIGHNATSLRNLCTFTTLETLRNPLRALLTPQTLRALTLVDLRPQPDATWAQPPARTLASWPETQALRLT